MSMNRSGNSEAAEPIFLRPYFQQNIWGGRRLAEEFGFAIPEGHVGECWAVSAYPGRESVAVNGAAAGRTLAELWRDVPEFFGPLPEEYRAAGYPFLTKIIDAREDLSIQVHPDDAYAAEHENGARGKTECWYILDCPEDCTLVLGHTAKSREEFAGMIAEKRWDSLLRRVPVRRGDFIQLEPGTIHAITAGVMLLETQQSSDVTYRVYDYDRLQDGRPRELHIRQSIEVSGVPAREPEKLVRHTDALPAGRLTELVRCRFYYVSRLPVSDSAELPADRWFRICTVTDGGGSLIIKNSSAPQGSRFPLKKGDSFLLPASVGGAPEEGAVFEGRMDVIVAGPVI
ncbi:type I phosphomannose isomerase catalytic subunit [Lachnoclostridium sp. Marseille-P6806]|uniref:type I phosphomannose isomerase catalytic subunit n=1 Tax=Lachnoclostridium sp. Marseille-P6806 TaxID=2364793 RepID=UPI001A934446|nr:type I phosphomannose isomerase catalytic subunit [Lachnoclostridium sp. Marseille-P6806]